MELAVVTLKSAMPYTAPTGHRTSVTGFVFSGGASDKAVDCFWRELVALAHSSGKLKAVDESSLPTVRTVPYGSFYEVWKLMTR
jgi:hypothetical protein